MYGIIYQITNKLNGKLYIGQTIKTVEYRFKKHLSDAKRKASTVFQRALRKYGEDNFILSVLDKADSLDELNSKEIFYIKQLESLCSQKGYNELIGGGSSQCSDYTRRKRSKSLKGLKRTPEQVQNMKDYWTPDKKLERSLKTKGKSTLSEESIERMKITKTGKPNLSRRKAVKCLNTGKIYDCGLDACKELNISSGNLSKVLTGKLLHTKGYKFEYV